MLNLIDRNTDIAQFVGEKIKAALPLQLYVTKDYLGFGGEYKLSDAKSSVGEPATLVGSFELKSSESGDFEDSYHNVVYYEFHIKLASGEDAVLCIYLRE